MPSGSQALRSLWTCCPQAPGLFKPPSHPYRGGGSCDRDLTGNRYAVEGAIANLSMRRPQGDATPDCRGQPEGSCLQGSERQSKGQVSQRSSTSLSSLPGNRVIRLEVRFGHIRSLTVLHDFQVCIVGNPCSSSEEARAQCFNPHLQPLRTPALPHGDQLIKSRVAESHKRDGSPCQARPGCQKAPGVFAGRRRSSMNEDESERSGEEASISCTTLPKRAPDPYPCHEG